MVCPQTMAMVMAGSWGSRPRRESPRFRQWCSISPAMELLRSCLLMITPAGTPKWAHNSVTRSRSCRPDGVGSVTMTASEAPDNELITGHPMPGGPSERMNSNPASRARSPARCRNNAIRRPEFSSPAKSCACTMGPKGVFEINHSPQCFCGKSMASAGQRATHTLQPSHLMGFMPGPSAF